MIGAPESPFIIIIITRNDHRPVAKDPLVVIAMRKRRPRVSSQRLPRLLPVPVEFRVIVSVISHSDLLPCANACADVTSLTTARGRPAK